MSKRKALRVVMLLPLALALRCNVGAHSTSEGPLPQDIIDNKDNVAYLKESAHFETPKGSDGLHYFYKENRTAQELILKLLKSEETDAELAALIVIGHCGSVKDNDLRKAIFVRLSDLSMSPVAEIRIRTVLALGRAGMRQGIPTLIFLLNDSNAEVRGMAIHTLYGFRAETAIHLLKALRNKETNKRNLRRIDIFLESAPQWKAEPR